MRVSEWMTPAPITVTPSTAVPKVQGLMRHRRIRHLPVLEDGRLVGIITDRDVRTVDPSPATSLGPGERHYLFERLTVRAVMTRPVLTVTPGDSLAEAVRLMLENRIGCLPVLEGQRLVGILTGVDVLRAFSTTLGVRAGRPPRPADAPLTESSADRVILVPLDGSAGCETVLETIGEIARAEDASVRLLSVHAPVHEVQAGGRRIDHGRPRNPGPDQAPYWTSITGTVVVRSTRSATLPFTIRAMPVRRCVAMAISVAREAFASSTICSTGSPKRTTNDTVTGPRPATTRWKYVRASASTRSIS